MRLLVSGASVTVRRLAEVSAYRAHLGHLFVPGAGNAVALPHQTGLPFAVDNGAFSPSYSDERFVATLRRTVAAGPEWVVVPDFVSQAAGTVSSFDWWLRYFSAWGFDLAEGDLPLALVGQDGMEDLDLDYWLGMARCFFMGGSTEWKLSDAAGDLAVEAKKRGLWLHMGRVNSFKRLHYAWTLGCDSVDGSGYSAFPDTRLPAALDYLVALEGRQPMRQKMLPFGMGVR